MKDKVVEVQQLNTELISHKEEQQEAGEQSEDIEETRDGNHDLKTQLKEPKRKE